tara:strand:+ start:14296 stop:16524 length:2229 start_codon:yes stop_codon:yes gene_type:complete
MEYKSILAHDWPDYKYEFAVKYLTHNDKKKFANEDKQIKNMSPDAKSNLLSRFKKSNDGTGYQSSDGITLSYISYTVPYWFEYDIPPLPIVFTVVKYSDITKTIHKFFSSEQDYAMNYKTLYDKIRTQFYLGISRSDVIDYLKNFPLSLREINQTGKNIIIKSFRPLYPFQYWQIDHIDFSNTIIGQKSSKGKVNDGYQYILVVIDIFSKFVYLFPTKTNDMQSVEYCLTKIFMQGDIPEKIGADNAFWSLGPFLNKYNVKLIIGKPYRPESQGHVENKNKQIKRYINHHFNRYNTYKYYDILDQVAFSINNTVHAVTKLTPNLVHRGRTLSTKIDDNIDKIKNRINASDIVSTIDVNKDDHLKYIKMRDKMYEHKISHVRNTIHKVADKREEQNKEVQPIQVGSTVKLATYIKIDDKIQPVQIKIQRTFDNSAIPEYVKLNNPLTVKSKDESNTEKRESVKSITRQPKTMFSKIDKNTTKWDWSLPQTTFTLLSGQQINLEPQKNLTFEVSSYTLNKAQYQYTLDWISPDGDRWKVLQLISSTKYAKEFTSNLLLKTQSTNTSPKTRPDYKFIDLTTKPLSKKQKQTSAATFSLNPEMNDDEFLQLTLNKHEKAYKLFIKFDTHLNTYKDYGKRARIFKDTFDLGRQKIKVSIIEHYDLDKGGVELGRDDGVIVRYGQGKDSYGDDKAHYDIEHKKQIRAYPLQRADIAQYTATIDFNLKRYNWCFREPSEIITKLTKFFK